MPVSHIGAELGHILLLNIKKAYLESNSIVALALDDIG